MLNRTLGVSVPETVLLAARQFIAILEVPLMSTMPNTLLAPIRRDEILKLAAETRSRFSSASIDDVAHKTDIILVRTNGPFGKDAGFAHIDFFQEPIFIESLARPFEKIRAWGHRNPRTVRSIVINPNAGIPEREVFWHEYFHLFYSPHAVQRSERFMHRFSTEGALHRQEERRANEFAAAILIPSIRMNLTVTEIAECFAVSDRLAQCAIRFYGQVSKPVFLSEL